MYKRQEKGTIVYTGYEFAEWALVENNQSLTENDQVLILKFDFTNKQTNPAQVQSAFQIQAFQNGVETVSYTHLDVYKRQRPM